MRKECVLNFVTCHPIKQTEPDTWLTVTHLNGKTRDREFFVLMANIFPNYSKGKYYVIGLLSTTDVVDLPL
jgi:hypothetical protein